MVFVGLGGPVKRTSFVTGCVPKVGLVFCFAGATGLRTMLQVFRIMQQEQPLLLHNNPELVFSTVFWGTGFLCKVMKAYTSTFESSVAMLTRVGGSIQQK